jgi:hypothetical protein
VIRIGFPKKVYQKCQRNKRLIGNFIRKLETLSNLLGRNMESIERLFERSLVSKHRIDSYPCIIAWSFALLRILQSGK